MTSIITRRTEFGGITGMGGPLSDPLVALAGPRHTILRAEKSGGQMVFLGESEDLGAEPLAVENSSSPNFHVLTAAGVVRVSSADAPQIVSQTAFKPGDGRWLALFGSFLATPLANGGVQTLNATSLAQVSQLPGVVQDSRFACGYAANGVLYAVDSKAAKICVLKVTSAGQLQYVGKVAAPNCRDIVKVVLDEDRGNLFVVCRRRIVRFTVPVTSVTDDDDLLPTFAQDYGVVTADYTDLVVLGDNQYWIGQDTADNPTPLPFFYGPMLGVWDDTLAELFVAAPRGDIWTVNNVIPVWTEDDIDIPDTADEILPDPPVITSALTYDVDLMGDLAYTIAATGDGPITYGVVNPPAWLTGINPFTGELSGTPTSSTSIQITATNAGGTDTETLVINVVTLADFSAIRFNGAIGDMWLDRADFKLYIGGGGTAVTDASGTYVRANASCIDLLTGLFTAWAPVLSTSNCVIYGDATWIYVSGVVGCNGGTAGRPQRVNKTSGTVNDAGFVASALSNVGVVSDGTYIWAGPHINGAVAPGVQGTYQVGSNGAVSNTTYVGSATTIADGCAPSGFTDNGNLFGACQAGLPAGPPYKSSGIFIAGPSTGSVATPAYGVGGSHSQISAGGKIVSVGTFTHIIDMSLNNVYATSLGVAILGRRLDAYYPFSVTFTRASWGGGYNGCAVDPLTDDVFIAGEGVASVEGNSARKTIFKVLSGGTLNTTFNPSFSAAGIVVKSFVVGNCLLMGGSGFGTVNGDTRDYFAALRADTGALFTG